MAIVDFNSATWGDPWVRKLPKNAKILFLYLWTNNHKNLIAMYAIDPETISFETGLSVKEVLAALDVLKPKVLYDPKTYYVWVVNHVRHQFMRGKMSPKIVDGIKKLLLSIRHPFTGKFLTVYKDIQELQELTDRVYVGYLDSGYPTSVGEGEGGGKGEGGDVSSKKDKAIFGEFKKVKLTEDEYQKLVERFTESGAKDRIKNLDEYIASKGKKYADHYATILTWERKNGTGQSGTDKSNPQAPRTKAGGIAAAPGHFDGVTIRFDEDSGNDTPG